MKRFGSLTLVAAFAAFNATVAIADDHDAPIVRSSVSVKVYDGVTDDLLSAGLNLAGLVSAVPPGFADPLNPTPEEIRRRAIYGNYRGSVDTVVAGGMGLL